MERWRGIEQIPGKWGRCVVTIGVFDGVHRGHQQIIGRAVQKAEQLGVPSVVLTFDPHPIEVIRPGSHPPMLTGRVRVDGLDHRADPKALRDGMPGGSGVHAYRPRCASASSRSMSRRASRSAMSRRRSCRCFPRASPSSTLARPRVEM